MVIGVPTPAPVKVIVASRGETELLPETNTATVPSLLPEAVAGAIIVAHGWLLVAVQVVLDLTTNTAAPPGPITREFAGETVKVPAQR